jgi:hypothetical protein
MGGHLLIYCTFVDERGVNIWMKPASPCLAPSPALSPRSRVADLKGRTEIGCCGFRLPLVQQQFPEACQCIPSIAAASHQYESTLKCILDLVPPAAFRRAPLPRVDRSGIKSPEAPVAQLDRALPSEGKGQRFESPRARQSTILREGFLPFTITASRRTWNLRSETAHFIAEARPFAGRPHVAVHP